MDEPRLIQALQPGGFFSTTPRRPVAEEMQRLGTRDLRPLVVPGQEQLRLPCFQKPLLLAWSWRSGGCLGPAAAQALNQHQRTPRNERTATPLKLDRGVTGGWHLSLLCPSCSRNCRTLYRPRTNPRWGCVACANVTYRSSNRSGGSGRRKPAASAIEKHGAAAVRIRRDYLGLPPALAVNIGFSPGTALLWKPASVSMSWERWEALRALAIGHELLWAIALNERLDRLASGLGLSFQQSDIGRHAIEVRARKLLAENAWARRQSNWKRGGAVRPGPAKRVTQNGEPCSSPAGS